MALMDWSDKLDTGVDSMNDEHKVILKYMNELYNCFEAGEDASKWQPVLDNLKDTTISHFTSEEAYMESIGFESLASHKVIHQNLLEKFTGHYTDIVKSKTLNKDFFNFLKFWLSSHIQGIDVKYGAWANK